MRLTNTLREAFVRAVMDDVPYVDYAEEFQSFATKTEVEALPPAIRKIWDDKTTRGWVKVFNPYQSFCGLDCWVPGFDEDKTQSRLKQRRDELEKLNDEQDQARTALKRQIHAVARSVSTRKALVERLPALEKYLPVDESATPTKNLPAIANLVADLSKAGWPKGAK